MADTLIQRTGQWKERKEERKGRDRKGKEGNRYRGDGSKDVFYFFRLLSVLPGTLFLFVRRKIKDGNCFFLSFFFLFSSHCCSSRRVSVPLGAHRASRCLAVITRHDKAPLFQAPRLLATFSAPHSRTTFSHGF